MKIWFSSSFGFVLILFGLFGLIMTMFTIWGNDGGIPALSLFIIILGLVFHYPSLLTDDTGATSTMRISTLFIISTFVILTVKAGWGVHSLKDLVIDQSWILVLSAGLGGKVLQSFSENTLQSNQLPPNQQRPIVPPPPAKP